MFLVRLQQKIVQQAIYVKIKKVLVKALKFVRCQLKISFLALFIN